MPLPSEPLVIPVEKKGRFSEGYALRFLCFDPRTRMAYLSDKGTKVRFWKHQMTLYALVPKLRDHHTHTRDGNGSGGGHASSSSGGTGPSRVNIRAENFDANDLMTFIMYGVGHHRINPDNATDKLLLERLPNLLEATFEGRGANAADGIVGTVAAETDKALDAAASGAYREGDNIGSRSNAPVSLQDDRAFLGRDRVTWQLRCPYYSAWSEMMMLMRDVLITDGLTVPLHGNFPGHRDPRNGLRIVTIPVWLAAPFRALTTAVVYSCIHGRMVGCDPQGKIGICMRHCYVCITDQDVLFMAESGEVARAVPIDSIERVEYSLTGGTSERGAGEPYIAFLTKGGLAEVLFMPGDAFTRGTASASMVRTMPRSDDAQEVRNMEYLLRTVAEWLNSINDDESSGADEDLVLAGTTGNNNDAVDLDLDDDGNNNSSGAAPQRSAAKGARRSSGKGGLTTVVVSPPSMTLEEYCATFEAIHGRAFKWQPQAGAQHPPPSVLQAHTLATRLGVPQPERQTITLQPEFERFYFPDGDPDVPPSPARPHSHSRRRDGGREHGTPQREHDAVDDLYRPTPPKKRGSKLLHALSPDPRMYIV